MGFVRGRGQQGLPPDFPPPPQMTALPGGREQRRLPPNFPPPPANNKTSGKERTTKIAPRFSSSPSRRAIRDGDIVKRTAGGSDDDSVASCGFEQGAGSIRGGSYSPSATLIQSLFTGSRLVDTPLAGFFIRSSMTKPTARRASSTFMPRRAQRRMLLNI